MTKYQTKYYGICYADAMRDAERRAQSGHGRRYEAALFGAVRFEGREKEISEQETAQFDTLKVV